MKHYSINQSYKLTTLKKKTFENMVGKGEYAGNPGFALSIAIVAECEKKFKCDARFFHLAKVRGDNFLSSNLNSAY